MSIKKILVFGLMIVLWGIALLGQGTRGYLKSGNWYPAEKETLLKDMDEYFAGVEDVGIDGRIRGIVAPHAGLAYSGLCSAQAFGQLKDVTSIDRVILLGVSHRGQFYGACVSSFDFDETPLGKLEVDREVTGKLGREMFFKVDNRIMELEHSIENQLPFLQKVFARQKIKIVPILFGSLRKEHFKAMAQTIGKFVDDRTLVVASSDFTHYGSNFGYVPFTGDVKDNLARLDLGMARAIETLDFSSYYKYRQDTGITMCGFTPVGVMMHLFKPQKYHGKLLSYYKSGDFTNDYSVSVSYASIVIIDGSVQLTLTDAEKKNLIRLARRTLENHFNDAGVPGDSDLQKEYAISDNLKRTAGVFVTLKKDGRLRGCIGTIIGSDPLYRGVMQNVLKSALHDPRFSPVTKGELGEIEIEISVMTPLQLIDNYKSIRLGTDGVIIRNGNRQAVYLPQVATETGWNLDQFLGSLCRKAGLPVAALRDKDTEFYIFQALVFHENEACHDS